MNEEKMKQINLNITHKMIEAINKIMGWHQRPEGMDEKTWDNLIYVNAPEAQDYEDVELYEWDSAQYFDAPPENSPFFCYWDSAYNFRSSFRVNYKEN